MFRRNCMSLLAKLRSSFLPKSKVIKISFIGLDKAGKSSILKWILDERFDETNDKRTIGLEVAKFHSAGIDFVAWDIGGQRGFRETIWESYLQGSRAVIYVIDASDKERIQESQLELEKYVFGNPKFASIPILILANKQDVTSALKTQEIEQILNYNLIKNRNKNIRLFGISCKNGTKIHEAFEWLCSQISNFDSNIQFSTPSVIHSVNI